MKRPAYVLRISLIFAIFAGIFLFPTGVTAAPSFHVSLVAKNLMEPVWVGASRHDGRLFAIERRGIIYVWHKGKRYKFLDIRNRVNDSGGEQGLLSMAFHNNFRSNGRYWVYYTVANGDARVVEFKAGGVRTLSSGRLIIAIGLGAGASNHNGGQLQYGPDSKLWIGVGDGGSAGDPNNWAQNRTVRAGKLLRIDVNNGRPYRIPSSNPYYGNSSYKREIMALGLRNPWRFSFDAVTGDLFIGDVGQGVREEIDWVAKGDAAARNFEWRRMEGLSTYDSGTSLTSGTVATPPILDYTHANGCSVTGGYVYRGKLIPSLVGYYVYADFCSTWIRGFKQSGGTATSQFVHSGRSSISSIGQGPYREIYLTQLTPGRIWRLSR